MEVVKNILKNYYSQYLQFLDKFLNNNGKISDIFTLIELKTNIKRTYLAQGVTCFFFAYMIFGYFAALVCNCVGFLYPAYASIKALESNQKEDDTKWLTYWVVFAAFSVVEFFSDIIFSWFPIYWLAKIIFLVWCFSPIPSNGSIVVYNKIIRPIFLKNVSTFARSSVVTESIHKSE